MSKEEKMINVRCYTTHYAIGWNHAICGVSVHSMLRLYHGCLPSDTTRSLRLWETYDLVRGHQACRYHTQQAETGYLV